MLDDGSAELFEGFWPFMKRFLLIFLPLWVFLICYSIGLHNIVSAIIAGLSVSAVAIFEKYKLKQQNE
tara:strand:- start:285 stop:488 length:204 start_codon:yes stop_codon:yes gene_type:complete